MFEVWCDLDWLAEQSNKRVDEMTTLLEHCAAAEARPFAPLLRADLRVHRGANEIHIAEPSFACGFERGIDARIVTPHVTDLQQPFPFTGKPDQYAKAFHCVLRRLFDVNVPARKQSPLRIARVILDCRFDHYDLGFSEELFGGEPSRAVRPFGAHGGVFLAKPDEAPVFRFGN